MIGFAAPVAGVGLVKVTPMGLRYHTIKTP
jgi:hypothetical protein